MITHHLLTAAQDFAELISICTTADQISEQLRKRLHRLGFDNYAYWRLWPAEGPRIPFFRSNYNPDFLSHYLREDYQKHDLVANYAARTVAPFSWTTIAGSRHLTPDQRRVFDDAREAGLKSGGSIPLPGPGAGKAVLSVADNVNAEAFSKTFRHHQPELVILGAIAHEKIGIFNDADKQKVPSLTNREIEILTWSAGGKSEWEIGSILAISAETVGKHLDNCRLKLNASNKTHAVAQALTRGLIIP